MGEEERRTTLLGEIWSWVLSIGIALAVALLVRYYLFEPMEIPSGSMMNTIQVNDRVVVSKLNIKVKPVKRGDIIVFHFPDEPESTPFVKRVIGIGGDSVEIKNGKLYLNGVAQDEPYIKEAMDSNQDYGPYQVPEGHFFMLGDNRNNSKDSRFWIHKYVSQDALIGKVLFRIFPFNRMGAVK